VPRDRLGASAAPRAWIGFVLSDACSTAAPSRIGIAASTPSSTSRLPDRLDLRAEHVRDALRAGLQIACSTDGHSVRGLENMTLSVATARRGWATPGDVLSPRRSRAILSGRRAV
jgi:histidinol phosphatase-like PHP family hydrolase